MQSKCNELQNMEKKFSDDILVKESAIMSLASDQIKELCEKYILCGDYENLIVVLLFGLCETCNL